MFKYLGIFKVWVGVSGRGLGGVRVGSWEVFSDVIL